MAGNHGHFVNASFLSILSHKLGENDKLAISKSTQVSTRAHDPFWSQLKDLSFSFCVGSQSSYPRRTLNRRLFWRFVGCPASQKNFRTFSPFLQRLPNGVLLYPSRGVGCHQKKPDQNKFVEEKVS